MKWQFTLSGAQANTEGPTVSVAHDAADVDRYAEVFGGFLGEVTWSDRIRLAMASTTENAPPKRRGVRMPPAIRAAALA